MKQLLIVITMLIGLSAKADLSSLGTMVSKSSGNSGQAYTLAQTEKLMQGSKPICINLKKTIIVNKAYTKVYGTDKQYCTTAMAKKFGIMRLNKNSFGIEVTKSLIKKGLI